MKLYEMYDRVSKQMFGAFAVLPEHTPWQLQHAACTIDIKQNVLAFATPQFYSNVHSCRVANRCNCSSIAGS